MSSKLMILPAHDYNTIRLVKIPDDYEEHEVFRHVTGIIAEVEENDSEYTWDDVLTALFHKLDRREKLHLILPNPDLVYPKTNHGVGIASGSVAPSFFNKTVLWTAVSLAAFNVRSLAISGRCPGSV